MTSIKIVLLVSLAVLAALAVSIVFWPGAANRPAVHWYTVNINFGNSTESFTGTSVLDPAQFGAQVSTASAPVTLGDLREFGLWDANKGFEWRRPRQLKKVSIVPKSIAYFSELTGDPIPSDKGPVDPKPPGK